MTAFGVCVVLNGQFLIKQFLIKQQSPTEFLLTSPQQVQSGLHAFCWLLTMASLLSLTAKN